MKLKNCFSQFSHYENDSLAWNRNRHDYGIFWAAYLSLSSHAFILSYAIAQHQQQNSKHCLLLLLYSTLGVTAALAAHRTMIVGPASANGGIEPANTGCGFQLSAIFSIHFIKRQKREQIFSRLELKYFRSFFFSLSLISSWMGFLCNTNIVIAKINGCEWLCVRVNNFEKHLKQAKVRAFGRVYCKTNTTKWHNEICRSSRRNPAATQQPSCVCVPFGKNKSSAVCSGHIALTREKKNGHAGFSVSTTSRTIARVLGVYLKAFPWHKMCTDQNGWNNNFVDDMRIILAVQSRGSSVRRRWQQQPFELWNSKQRTQRRCRRQRWYGNSIQTVPRARFRQLSMLVREEMPP